MLHKTTSDPECSLLRVRRRSECLGVASVANGCVHPRPRLVLAPRRTRKVPPPVLARISIGIAAMMVGVLIVAAYVNSREDDASLIPVATGEKAPAGLARFYDQKLDWTPCAGSLCTWVRVPLDYDKPAGETIRLRVKLRPATSGKAEGRIFINPGGPGGSGVGFVNTFASLTSNEVLRDRDIVGFDPRGVGQSDPVTCESDATFDKLIALDPDPDTLKLVDKLGNGFRALGKACVKNSGALASHVSTDEAARDLDVLRALMGQKKLDYYGASYGTQLGATYADLFPRRAGAMVLDGAVDPSRRKERQGFDQAKSFQRELKAYIAVLPRGRQLPARRGPEGRERQHRRAARQPGEDADQDPVRPQADRRRCDLRHRLRDVRPRQLDGPDDGTRPGRVRRRQHPADVERPVLRAAPGRHLPRQQRAVVLRDPLPGLPQGTRRRTDREAPARLPQGVAGVRGRHGVVGGRVPELAGEVGAPPTRRSCRGSRPHRRDRLDEGSRNALQRGRRRSPRTCRRGSW